MSTPPNPENPNARHRVYSASLLGVEGPECTIPKCAARGRTTGTGWLEQHAFGWRMEFDCPLHGTLYATGGVWTAMIERVLKAQQPPVQD
jgi:hypothetical protein